MNPDKFSSEFANILFSHFPEWKVYEQHIDYEDKDYPYSYLLIEVPSPVYGEASKLYIYTQDEEVTIGFDKYHTHQSYIENEETYLQAIDFIKDFIAEKILIVVTMEGERWKYSRTIRTAENIPKTNDGERNYVRSWKGTFDRGC